MAEIRETARSGPMVFSEAADQILVEVDTDPSAKPATRISSALGNGNSSLTRLNRWRVSRALGIRSHSPLPLRPRGLAPSSLKSRAGLPRGSQHVGPVHLVLPSDVEARLSPESAALHLAIGLFVTEEATLGQASTVAGVSHGQFLKELGSRRIPIHYGTEELASDLAAVADLSSR